MSPAVSAAICCSCSSGQDGHVFRVERASRSGLTCEVSADGRQVQNKIGPAWSGRGRAPAGGSRARRSSVALRRGQVVGRSYAVSDARCVLDDLRFPELAAQSADRDAHRVGERIYVLIPGLLEQSFCSERARADVAETDAVDRYVWLGDRVGSRTVLIPNLPSGDDHTLKNIVVGRHHNLYFDIGSTSNASPSPRSSPPYAAVMEYASSGRRIRVWATGVRNGDGLSFAPDGSLWTAVNERDDIAYPFHRAYGGFSDAFGHVIQAYVNNHPPDEIAKLSAGRNLGWPFCDPDPDLAPGAVSTGFSYGDLKFDFDEGTNPGGHNRGAACRTGRGRVRARLHEGHGRRAVPRPRAAKGARRGRR
jgi:hypothetical protein